MSTGRSDFESALGRAVAAHLGHVGPGGLCCLCSHCSHPLRCTVLFQQIGHDLLQIACAQHSCRLRQRRFFGAGLRQNQARLCLRVWQLRR
jgi:hypothetical protein